MPLTFRRRDFIFLIFPKLRFTKFSFDSVKWLYDFNKKRRNKQNNSKAKMKWSMIIAAGSGVAFLIAILFGFVWFPRTIKAKIKKMVNLDPHSDIRKMFVKVPFGLDFKVYMFNVTNSLDVHAGKTPIVSEIGPFCYKEWKEKVEVSDDDENDVMFYKSKDTFYKSREPGCLSGEELITLPHPMILGMVNILIRTKPAMLTLAAKAINSIYRNPPTIFLTAKANDLLFDGVIIDCNVSDFAGKAVCSQLKAEGSGLMPISDTELGFSFIGPKNGTGKKFKVYRGVKESRNVGLVLEYDEKKEMDVWPTKECNQFKGTDGTIFPPMLEAEEGLAAFAPDLCRSLISVYEQDTKYDGIPVRLYTATLGDMSKNADEKCYCPTPETCLKKGIMDLFKCADAAIYASLPHFYEADESYVNGVIGLKPNREQHGIEILFEPLTGSPVQAKKRLMFSMPLETNAKVKQFNNLSTVILPMFWIEEGVALNATFIKPLKDLARIIKIVEVFSWLLTVGSVGGLAAAVYLHLHQSGKLNITRKEVKPEKNNRGMSGVSQDGFGGHVNHAMSDNEIEKY